MANLAGVPQSRFFPAKLEAEGDDAIFNTLLSTSRSPPWRIAKPAVSQMPGVLESDRVSGKHDVAFDGRVAQRSRTRVLPTYEAGPWTVCSRLAGRARQSGRGGK